MKLIRSLLKTGTKPITTAKPWPLPRIPELQLRKAKRRFFCPAKRAAPAPVLAKIFRETPRASAATHARAFSARSAAADATVAQIAVVTVAEIVDAATAATIVLPVALDAPNAVIVVQTVALIVVVTEVLIVVVTTAADAASNAVRVAAGITIAATKAATPARAVRNSFPKC